MNRNIVIEKGMLWVIIFGAVSGLLYILALPYLYLLFGTLLATLSLGLCTAILFFYKKESIDAVILLVLLIGSFILSLTLLLLLI